MAGRAAAITALPRVLDAACARDAAPRSGSVAVGESFVREGTPGDRTDLPGIFGGDVAIGGGLGLASVDQGDWFDFRGSGDGVIGFFGPGGNSVFTFRETGGVDPGDGTMAAFSFISATAIGTVGLTGTKTAFDDLACTTEGGRAVIPLPATLPLILGALAGVGLLSRRRKRAGANRFPGWRPPRLRRPG